MALPNEHLTPKMEELRETIRKMSPQDLSALPPLEREDHEMIGNFVQNFNFIDLNLRRALEIFEVAKMLPDRATKAYPDIPDSQLAGVVSDVIATMDPSSEDQADALDKLAQIAWARQFRNLMGHFAAKRFPNEDVIVFASKNDRDARNTLGRQLARHHIQTAVAGRAELRNLTVVLAGHSNWLAQRIPVWDKRFPAPE